jgi:rubrerythrin
MRQELKRLEQVIAGGGVCPRCGLPTGGRVVGRIVKLNEGEEPPAPCPVCGSKGLGIVTIRTVSAPGTR